MREEVFIDATQDVFGAIRLIAQANRADEVNEFAEPLLVETGARVIFRQDTFERWVYVFDGDHRIVNQFADGGLLGVVLQVRPARFGRYPKNVDGAILVGVFGVGALALLRDELRAIFLERIGNVFEKDQTEDDVFVFRRVHIVAQLVSRRPQRGFKTKVRAVR